jgi:hypothetical protein
VGEGSRGPEEESAHGGAKGAVTADGERGTSCDRAREVAELHRRRSEARHGRPDLGRCRKCERVRDEGASPGKERRAGEESRARHDACARCAEEAVRQRKEDREQDEHSAWRVADEPTAEQVAGNVSDRRDREQAPRQRG